MLRAVYMEDIRSRAKIEGPPTEFCLSSTFVVDFHPQFDYEHIILWNTTHVLYPCEGICVSVPYYGQQ